MGRKKINIREIENSRQKTVTFARRRAGLIKKAHELSILCGVKVAVVIFDTKNASHVYSSADTPEELFTRYLNKQFLTNESRKRKDASESSSDDYGGTYGFDGNGSFIRRHLAVVNEYKVMSDGPNSRNLHVKYTKQYHNPSSNANKRQSTASTSSSNTLDQSSPPSVLSSLKDQMYLHGANIRDLYNNPALGQQLMCGLPARSASLFKYGVDAMANPVSAAHVLPFSQGNAGECPVSFEGYPMPFAGVNNGMNTGQVVDTRGVDVLKSATRDFSALSLLSDNGGHGFMHGMGTTAGANGMSLGFGDMLNAMSGSPISTSGSSNYSNSNGLLKHACNSSEDVDGHRNKRPKSQAQLYSDYSSGPAAAIVSAHPENTTHTGNSNTPVDDCSDFDLDRSLVENFLSNTGVTELLNTSWRQNQSGEDAEKDCVTSEMYDSESEDEDAEDDVSYESADDDDDDDDESEHEEPSSPTENNAQHGDTAAAETSADVLSLNQQHQLIHDSLISFTAGETNSNLQAHQNMVCTLQSLGMVPTNCQFASADEPMNTSNDAHNRSMEQLYNVMSEGQNPAIVVDTAPTFSFTHEPTDVNSVNSHQYSFAEHDTSMSTSQPYTFQPEMLLAANSDRVF
ncbi:hypothetical protein GGF49_003895 [Coemansia sp. RSA 1853]|nr:hypothetical protein GGF49_003895 [Coemansia sp. RSA 1853]